MDGLAVAEQIHADPQLQSLTVMMLTSDHRSGHHARARELGVAAYLAKPLARAELYQTVNTLVGEIRPGEDGVAVKDEMVRDLPPLHILLAEDDLLNAKMARHLLEKGGHEVVVVHTGKEALAALDNYRFDVVLMDVQMPEMDGYEATRRIRERSASRGGNVPIIALTAFAFKEDRDRCLAVGMDAFATKPIDRRELVQVIGRLVATPEGKRRSLLTCSKPCGEWREMLTFCPRS